MKIDEHAEEMAAWKRRAQDLADALEWTEAVSRGEPHPFDKERCEKLAKVRLSVGVSGRPRPPLGHPPVFAEDAPAGSPVPQGRRLSRDEILIVLRAYKALHAMTTQPTSAGCIELIAIFERME